MAPSATTAFAGSFRRSPLRPQDGAVRLQQQGGQRQPPHQLALLRRTHRRTAARRRSSPPRPRARPGPRGRRRREAAPASPRVRATGRWRSAPPSARVDVERQVELDGQVDEQREDLPLNRAVALLAYLPAVQADLADGGQTRTFPADQVGDPRRFRRIQMRRVEAGRRENRAGAPLGQFEVAFRVRPRLADGDHRLDAGGARPIQHFVEIAGEARVAQVSVTIRQSAEPARRRPAAGTAGRGSAATFCPLSSCPLDRHPVRSCPLAASRAPRRSSSSSAVLGQSLFSRRERARSASSRPPVWQRAQ